MPIQPFRRRKIASRSLLNKALIRSGAGNLVLQINAGGGGGGNVVTIDTVGTPVTQALTWQTKTCAVTVNNHNNRAIVLMIAGGSSSSDPLLTPTSDQGGTFVQKAIQNTGTGWGFAQIWVMVNPAVATHTITITVSASGAWHDLGFGAVSLYNVDPVTPTGTAVQTDFGGAAQTAPTTGSITVGTGGMAIAVVGSDSEATMTVTAGTTFTGYPLLNIDADTSVGAANRTTTGAITWTTDSAACCLVGIPFNAL